MKEARVKIESKSEKISYLHTTRLHAACMAWGGNLYRLPLTTPFTNHAEQVHFRSKVLPDFLKIQV
jgi:hypothetical protein